MIVLRQKNVRLGKTAKDFWMEEGVYGARKEKETAR